MSRTLGALCAATGLRLGLLPSLVISRLPCPVYCLPVGQGASLVLIPAGVCTGPGTGPGAVLGTRPGTGPGGVFGAGPWVPELILILMLGRVMVLMLERVPWYWTWYCAWNWGWSWASCWAFGYGSGAGAGTRPNAGDWYTWPGLRTGRPCTWSGAGPSPATGAWPGAGPGTEPGTGPGTELLLDLVLALVLGLVLGLILGRQWAL
jgi:hypothetical protein